MTDHAQVALEFCRECLRWEDAYHSGDGYIVSPCRSGAGVWSPEDSGNLNAVMEAVRGWCDNAPACLTIEYECDRFDVLISLYDENGSYAKGTGQSDDPCHALLSACVDASRKLKDQSGSPSLTR